MPVLTPPDKLRSDALALESARNSAVLTVKYADKTVTYRTIEDIECALQHIYAELRFLGELPPAPSRQVLPTNQTGWEP